MAQTTPQDNYESTLEYVEPMPAPPIDVGQEARQESPTPPSTAGSIQAQKAGLPDSETSTLPTSAFERRLVWKIDLFILPILITVNFLAQMGRSDIANAKIAGMGEDLSITPSQYSMIASIFLIGYTVFQPAGTLFLHLLSPPVQFGGAMLAWGTVTICHLQGNTYTAILALRFFVGMAEAFVQGTVLYLSFWYTYRELALRGAIFQATSSLAGAFNGLIAYAITTTLDGRNGWPAWKWIFFIEGLVPLVFSIVVFFLLPSIPDKAKLGFSQTERDLLVKRSRAAHNTADTKLRPPLVWKALIDPKVIMLGLLAGGTHFAMTSLSNFMPDIILGLGYSQVNAQLMSVIVYACGTLTTLFAGWLSDKLNRRGMPLIISLCVMVVGYVLLLTTTSLQARFAATCLLAMGGFPAIVLTLMWMVVNVVGYTKRGTTLALMNIVGQVCGIGGNQAYSDPPLYRQGHGASLGAVGGSLVICALIYGYLTWLNKVKRREQWGEKAAKLRDVSYDIIGDDHPDFFYTL